VRHWYPTRFLNPAETESNFAVLLLNCRPITDEEDRKYISILWPKARIRACADGGANKLAALNKVQGTAFYPDFICGDLDSVRKENMDFFQQHGAALYKDTNPNATDYTKSARILAKQINDDPNSKVDTIVTIGGLYGRFDHVMGCIHTLFLLQKEFPKLPIYCIQERSLFTLLPSGRHAIHLDEGIANGVCGLVPIGCPAEKVTTTGLQWNLTNQKLAFGTLVSTSNRVISPEIQVTTDSPLLWILNLKV